MNTHPVASLGQSAAQLTLCEGRLADAPQGRQAPSGSGDAAQVAASSLATPDASPRRTVAPTAPTAAVPADAGLTRPAAPCKPRSVPARPTSICWRTLYQHALGRLDWCECEAAPAAQRLQHIQDLTQRASSMAPERPLVYMDVESGHGKQLVLQVESLLPSHPTLIVKSIEKLYDDDACGLWQLRGGHVMASSVPLPKDGVLQRTVAALRALSGVYPDNTLLFEASDSFEHYRKWTQVPYDLTSVPPSAQLFYRSLAAAPDIITVIDGSPLDTEPHRSDANIYFNSVVLAPAAAVMFDGRNFATLHRCCDISCNVSHWQPFAAMTPESTSFEVNLLAAAQRLNMVKPVACHSVEVILWSLQNHYPQAITLLSSSVDGLIEASEHDDGDKFFSLQHWLEELRSEFLQEDDF